MNFYGHAFIAERERPDPAFVFGSMLPDFEGMAHVRVRDVASETVRDGVACHHVTDHAFHTCPTFVGCCARSVEMMTADGLPRGPARAVAHVGLELLLDGFIVRTYGPSPMYLDALRTGHAMLRDGTLGLIDASNTPALMDMLSKLIDFGPPRANDEPSQITGRLVRMLRERPRLAIPEAMTDEVTHHIEHLTIALPEVGPLLIEAASTPVVR
jgi:hypothetical protein